MALGENRADHLLSLTADIVSSHLANNVVPKEDVSKLITSVFSTLHSLSEAKDKSKPDRAPAIEIENSITPDFLICLEDGKKLKMLKRHLKARYGLSPDEYRQRWDLPADYPMVAPNYAKRRQQLAREIGLGRNRAKKS